MTLNLREKILVFVLSIVVVLFIGVKLLLTPAFGALSLHTQSLLDMQTKQAHCAGEPVSDHQVEQ